MKRVIWKIPLYPPDRDGEITLQLPQGAELLTVEDQREGAMLYCLVPNAPSTSYVERTFLCINTGNVIDKPNLKYICTFRSIDGQVVWHFFEVLP